MAYSYTTVAADGSTTVFVVPFNYIDKSHIHAKVNGVETSYSWLNSSTISISPAPTGQVEIRRITPKDTPPVDFSDGSVLKEAELDLLALFSLYCVQEGQDTADTAIAQSSLGIALARVYQGVRATPPTVRTDGSAILVGDMYFDSVSLTLKVYTGILWQAAGATVPGVLKIGVPIIATAGQTIVPVAGGYDPTGMIVLLNGVAVNPSDMDISSGTNIVFSTALDLNDEVRWISFGVFLIGTIPDNSVKDTSIQAGSKLEALINTGVRNVRKFGATGNGTDQYLAIQAAVDDCPVGGTVYFPTPISNYLTSQPILINKSINLVGEGSVVRQLENGAKTASGVLWLYSGTGQQLHIQRDSSVAQALNGIKVTNFDFRPTVPGANTRGVTFDANGNAIFGVKFDSCRWQEFGKAACRAASATGDVWDIQFENCSAANHSTSTEDMFYFFPTASGGAGLTGGFNITFNNCYLQSFKTGLYAAKAGSLYMNDGIVEGLNGGNGTYSGSSSKIVGTHYEAFLAGTCVGITLIGGKSICLPGTVQGWVKGASLSTTSTIVFPTFEANTTDIVIESGGSRSGTVIFGGTCSVSDLRLFNDGINEVLKIKADDWRTWTPALKFGGANVGMTGTMTGSLTFTGRSFQGDFQISLTNKGSSTGPATITGLPVSTATYGAVDIAYHSNMAVAKTYQCRLEAGTSSITLGSYGAVATANLSEADFTNTSIFFGSFTGRT